MAKPSGEIIETPITANFREGLTVLQYFISTHGARKGLADTALKTADSGYLTRRLVDVAQDVIISRARLRHARRHRGAGDRRIGRDHRAAARPHRRPRHAREDRRSVQRRARSSSVNEEIDEDKASAIQEAGIEKVKIRSVLTCASRRGVCARCYGRDLATGRLVELGLAVGVIAAQSIGEPGTQLTMRTFHIGGTASRISEQNTLDARHTGTVHYEGLPVVETHKEGGQLIVMNRNGSLVVKDEKGRDRERYPIVYGARLKVKDGQKVEQGQIAGRVGSVHVLDPHRGAGHDPLQGHHRGPDGPRGSRRGHRPVALHHRRLAGREEAADDRDQGQDRQGQRASTTCRRTRT